MGFFQRNEGLDALLHRRGPSNWQLFIKEPCLYLARLLYSERPIIPIKPIMPVTVVCISDTHNSRPKIPFGDILVHAGDLTQGGTLAELQTTLDWIHMLPHQHKIVIGGNHDAILDPSFPGQDPTTSSKEIQWRDIIYLKNETATITCSNGRTLKIHGSPLTPKHGNWPFQYPRSVDVWANTIPSDLDILITHGPPKGHLDCDGLGCASLLKEMWRARPRLHVFGHVHAGFGTEWIQFDGLQRSFEAVQAARGGVWNLAWVGFEFLRVKVSTLKESRALLVNAAQVGGLRDELKRQPIVVET